MSELVHYGVGDQVATLTLDSPHNRNALSRQLVAELSGRLAEAVAEPSARAVVITHTGRVFCAGADLAEAGSQSMTGSGWPRSQPPRRSCPRGCSPRRRRRRASTPSWRSGRPPGESPRSSGGISRCLGPGPILLTWGRPDPHRGGTNKWPRRGLRTRTV